MKTRRYLNHYRNNRKQHQQKSNAKRPIRKINQSVTKQTAEKIERDQKVKDKKAKITLQNLKDDVKQLIKVREVFNVCAKFADDARRFCFPEVYVEICELLLFLNIDVVNEFDCFKIKEAEAILQLFVKHNKLLCVDRKRSIYELV